MGTSLEGDEKFPWVSEKQISSPPGRRLLLPLQLPEQLLSEPRTRGKDRRPDEENSQGKGTPSPASGRKRLSGSRKYPVARALEFIEANGHFWLLILQVKKLR